MRSACNSAAPKVSHCFCLGSCIDPWSVVGGGSSTNNIKENGIFFQVCKYFYYCLIFLRTFEMPENFESGTTLLGGQVGHLPTQFFRDQRQKIPQN